MQRLLAVLAIGTFAAAVVAAVALAAGGGSRVAPGATTPAATSPGAATASPPAGGVISSPPLTASPAPAPPAGIAGGTPPAIPAGVASKFEPSWGLLGTVMHVTSAPPAAPNDGAPTSGARAVLGSFLVVGDRRHLAPDGIDRAFVAVTSDTRLYRLVDGDLVPCGFAALHEGAIVAVRFTGPVAESYPVQATAGQVVLLAD